MSIINEALKKAQSVAEEKTVISSESKKEGLAAAREAAVQAAPKIAGQRKGVIFIIIIAIFFVAAFIFRHYRAASKMITPLLAPAGQPGYKFDSAGMPRLNINGIVYDENAPYAIVNNKVLSKGETIDGAVLIQINKDSLVFSFDNKEFELRQE